MAEASMEAIGRISAFFAHPSAAVIELTKPLRVGETIYIKGHTTDFQQVVESLQVDRQPLQEAQTGQAVGLKVKERCRKQDIVYKLVSYAGWGRMKFSTGKLVLPARKQVFRVEHEGLARHDVIARHDEQAQGRPLLRRVMEGGHRTAEGREPLDSARERARRELERLPARVRALVPADPPYPVKIGRGLERTRDEVRRRIEAAEKRS